MIEAAPLIQPDDGARVAVEAALATTAAVAAVGRLFVLWLGDARICLQNQNRAGGQHAARVALNRDQ